MTILGVFIANTFLYYIFSLLYNIILKLSQENRSLLVPAPSAQVGFATVQDADTICFTCSGCVCAAC